MAETGKTASEFSVLSMTSLWCTFLLDQSYCWLLICSEYSILWQACETVKFTCFLSQVTLWFLLPFTTVSKLCWAKDQ